MILLLNMCLVRTQADRAVYMGFEEGAADEAHGGEGQHDGEGHGLEDVR